MRRLLFNGCKSDIPALSAYFQYYMSMKLNIFKVTMFLCKFLELWNYNQDLKRIFLVAWQCAFKIHIENHIAKNNWESFENLGG